MANTLEFYSPELWAAEAQKTFLKESTALAVANTSLEADLQMGKAVHKPYSSYPRVQTYTKGTAVTFRDLSTTDEQLDVDTAKVAPFYVDMIDSKQNKYDAIAEFGATAGRQLTNVIDQAVILSGVTNAGKTLTAADIGEAAGPIVHTAANTAAIFTAAGRTLNSKNRMGGERFALIGPRALEIIQNYVGGRETGFGDTVSDNGRVATRFGFQLILTNNSYYTALLTLATEPTANDTVSVNGVTFTFVASPTVAGDVDLGGSADTSRANLTAAINDSGTAGTTYIQLSAENRQLLEASGIVATNDNGANTMAIVGYGDIVVAQGLTDAADIWSVQYSYMLMGIKGSIDLVTQVRPNIVFRDVQDKLGKNVLPWTLYGTKTFERMKGNLVSVRVDASAWV